MQKYSLQHCSTSDIVILQIVLIPMAVCAKGKNPLAGHSYEITEYDFRSKTNVTTRLKFEEDASVLISSSFDEEGTEGMYTVNTDTRMGEIFFGGSRWCTFSYKKDYSSITLSGPGGDIKKLKKIE